MEGWNMWPDLFCVTCLNRVWHASFVRHMPHSRVTRLIRMWHEYIVLYLEGSNRGLKYARFILSDMHYSCVIWLQHTATHCNTLQHTATHCDCVTCIIRVWSDCNTLQHTATHCNYVTCIIPVWSDCNTLQHTATHCNCVTCIIIPVWSDEFVCGLLHWQERAQVCYSLLQIGWHRISRFLLKKSTNQNSSHGFTISTK